MRIRVITKTGAALAAMTFMMGSVLTMPAISGRPDTIEEFMELGQRPMVIAHRGFSGIAPENTMIAFKKSIEIKADMIELDVLLSKDGRVVCIHDETLDRTTNGMGLVADHTWEEMSKLDAGSWFSSEFAGEPLPLLSDAMDLTKGKILLNVEIKTEAYSPQIEDSVGEKVLRMIDERKMGKTVMITSFDPRILKQVRSLDGSIRTASLYSKNVHPGLKPLFITHDEGSNGFNLSKTEVSEAIVQACHSKNLPVCVYTVNTKQMMRHILGKGANALFTNYPDRMLELIDEMK